MDRSTLEFQAEASQKLYEQESARRDSVRASIAIPLAALTFFSFGFSALLINFDVSRSTFASHILSFGVVLAALTAVVAFFLAIWALYWVDYEAEGPTPYVTAVADQERDLLEALLQKQGYTQLKAEEEARQSAWRGAAKEYVDGANAQRVLNRANLLRQKGTLRCLLVALGALILALTMVGAIRLIDSTAEKGPFMSPYIGSLEVR